MPSSSRSFVTVHQSDNNGPTRTVTFGDVTVVGPESVQNSVPETPGIISGRWKRFWPG